jgi:hypothetical protein
MPPPTGVSLQFWILLIFAAGGAFFLLKQTRADLRGIGGVARDARAEAADYFFVTAILLMTHCLPEQRESLAKMLIETKLRRAK